MFVVEALELRADLRRYSLRLSTASSTPSHSRQICLGNQQVHCTHCLCQRIDPSMRIESCHCTGVCLRACRFSKTEYIVFLTTFILIRAITAIDNTVATLPQPQTRPTRCAGGAYELICSIEALANALL